MTNNEAMERALVRLDARLHWQRKRRERPALRRAWLALRDLARRIGRI